MELLRVINNNVVLARDGDQEVILTGRGLGFGAKAGEVVDSAKVTRRFEAVEGREPQAYALQIADIPPEHLALVDEALTAVRGEIPGGVLPSLLVAVADHMSFAIKRQRQGLKVELPMRAEVAHLYAGELRIAERVVAFINARLPEPVPDDEAIPIALHLVNAGFAGGDLSLTYQMTAVLRQVFEVIESAYGHPFDQSGVHAARFITHMRFFFVRMIDERQLNQDDGALHDGIRTSFPEAHRCARRVQDLLELRLGQPVTPDELMYLTVHIARLVSDSGTAPDK